jgi:hypothetical protein
MKAVSILIVLSGLLSPVTAQYYESDEHQPVSDRLLHAGLSWLDFQPRSSNTLPDSSVIRFERAMPLIGFRTGVLNLLFGYSSYRLRGVSRSAVHFSATVHNEFRLAGDRANAFLVQVLFSGNYLKAEGVGPARRDFDVASVGAGGGVIYRIIAGNMSLSLQAAEILHYSTEGFSTGNGFSPATTGEFTLLLNRVLVFDGIGLGYRFRLQTWSMGGHSLDYRSLSHGPYIGILF